MRCDFISDPQAEDQRRLSGRAVRFFFCIAIFIALHLYLSGAAIAAPAEIIVDNAALGVSDAAGGRTFTGKWCKSTAANKYGTDSLYSCGTSLDTYRWTPNITDAQSYDVYVWWSAHPNRSAAVPIKVVHGGGTANKSFNQKGGGGQWVLHGRYAFAVGTAGYIEVSDSGGQSAADAVRIVPADAGGTPSGIVIDNALLGVSDAAGGRTFTGTWCKSTGTDKFGADSLYSCGGARDTYRWTPTIPTAQSYDVYVWWSTNANRSATVPINVVYSGGSAAKNFDQRSGGGQWVLHGRYAFAVGKTGYAEVTDASGQASADAVRFVPAAGPPPPPPPPPVNTTQKDAARLMIQATYGPTLTGIDAIAATGAAAWIDAQLALPSTYSHLSYLKARVAANVNDGHNGIMQESIWNQAIKGPDQLRQRVAFAWSEIFVISSFRIFDAEGVSAYMDVLTRNALANYRTLLEAVTLNQAMGIYLDMLRSDKEDAATGRMPNENYPREVLQLFSIGLDELNQDGTPKLDGAGKAIPTYDQDVVLGFAKAFSGWSYGAAPLDDNGFYYGIYPYPANFWSAPMKAFPGHHSTAIKLLLRGTTLPAGQTAAQDLKDALDNIFNHPNVGPFIGKQLIQRLVTSNPTPAYVSRVAAVFNNNGAGVRGDMKAVIKAILMDNEARSATVAAGTQFGKQREPVVRWGNLVRAFNGTSTSGRLGFWNLESVEYGVGQAHFKSPSVFNFYQPDYAPQGPIADAKLVAPEFQITTDTQIISGSNVNKYLIYYGYGAEDATRVNLNYANVQSLASNPAALVDKLDLLMTGGNLSAATRTAVIDAVSAYQATQLKERTQAAVYLIALSPDFVIQK